MPKVVRDERLAARVRAFIEQCGSTSAAAAALGVNKTLLWRFDRTGCAIDRTRTQLAEALGKHEKETVPAENGTNATVVGLPENVSTEDLVAMRAFFQNMLHVIDAYVGSPAAGFPRPTGSGKVTLSNSMRMMGGQNGQP